MEKVAKLKKFSSKLKSFVVGCHVMNIVSDFKFLQSGLSSRAKHGGTVFSAVSGSIKDLATVPGSYNHLGP